jgi:exopolysaccharide biosynthesis WecB/TagA/CpsF family protein
MCHSLVFGLIAAEIVFILSSGDTQLRLFKAASIFFGVLVHLTLDEVYSVETSGARAGKSRSGGRTIYLKNSFGTALKLIDYKHMHSTIAFYVAALLLGNCALNVQEAIARFENAEQRKRLNNFDFVLPDGSGVSLACKIMGYKFCDNLNGTDLLPHLCEVATKNNLTMFFLGGRENVAQRASENLKMKYPNLKIVGTQCGYFDDDSAIIAQINTLKPDILFVGFGAIIQEKWLLENLNQIDCKLALAVGGLVDVYSGNLKRNPILRKLGLEWFGRLLQEPRRLFGRYVIGNPLFVLRVLGYKLFGKCGK